MILSILLCTCGCGNKCNHKDKDNNGVCDKCYNSVFIYFDFYALGDLANKSYDIEKITNYFNYSYAHDQNTIILSTGNMWNSANSGSTVWMNETGFDALTPSVNDLNLGKDFINGVSQSADFPLLAINIYDKNTDKLADFCQKSLIIKKDGFQIGVIGAVGDYSSDISSEYNDIYFKTGDELTSLVQDEARRLGKKGVDIIIYVLNMGSEYSDSYYDTSLSDGYVDLVFEGNTNQSYKIKDSNGVYHLQNNQSDSVGISHAEFSINTVTKTSALRATTLVSNDVYNEVEYTPPPQENDKENTKDTNKNNNSVSTDSTTSSTQQNQNTPSNSSSNQSTNTCAHTDSNNDEICDICKLSVIVYVDFYNINDLHGKLDDGDNHIGVDELTTYLKNARQNDDNAFFISTGDMWQGQAESNMTKGLIMTDWMNELDFTAMAIGNHEFDWGSEYIQSNADFAEFPLLAINIYDRATNKLASYCEPSIMVDAGGVQIGFIGAIGDCYSSIAADKCDDVYFKVGTQLTSLVKSEADKLRNNGADYIVYILHDGYGSSNYGSTTQISSSKIKSYYDVALSNGYVDLVFEGHTHQGYRLIDEYGVYHIQHRGDNQGGISHAEIAINSVTNQSKVTTAELVSVSQYQNLADDPIVDKLLEKYKDQISAANEVLGYNSSFRDDEYLEQLVANLYYETGVKAWGDKYNIVLGGGFLRTRSPYNLSAGNVTYGQLSSLFTFDNQITLCAVKGRDLKKKFFESNNSDYFISYGDYGSSVKNNIDLNATYYIVVDNYTADYAYNNLTIVERYDPNVFARDLLAEYVRKGGLS